MDQKTQPITMIIWDMNLTIEVLEYVFLGLIFGLFI